MNVSTHKLFLITTTIILWNAVTHCSSTALGLKTQDSDSLEKAHQTIPEVLRAPSASKVEEQKKFFETEIFNAIDHKFHQDLFMQHLPQLYKATINTIVLNEDSLLAFFIRLRRKNIITKLLELGGDPNNVVPYPKDKFCYFFDEPMELFHETPLTTAIFHSQDEIMQLLLDNKADPNLPNGGGITPLMKAAERGSSEISLPLLKAGANPNIQDNNGNTALLYIRELIVNPEAENLINLLLESGADPKIPNKKGATILTKAHKDLQEMKQRYAVEGFIYQKAMIDFLQEKITALEKKSTECPK
jgi:hypothetical protein